MGCVEIDLMGRFAVRRDGGTVEESAFGGRRVRQLVRVLAVERGRPVSRDLLIDALWGDHPPADPSTNLNVVVNRARRALGDRRCIATVSGGYVLPSEVEIRIDTELLEQHVRAARDAHAQGDPAAAAAAAEAALRLWGEPLPEDAYLDWARPHRERLERAHQDALEVAGAAALQQGRTREAITHAAEAVARQPLREAARVLLVRALAADGDVAAAVAAYTDLRRVLADELGLDPSPEAATIYEQLLRGSSPPVRRPPASLVGLPPLVGREAELRRLAAVGQDCRAAVVSGRSGSGKSRLLEAYAASSGHRSLAARALRPQRDEPWGLVRTLLRDPQLAAVDHAEILGSRSLAALSEVLPDLVEPQVTVDPQTRRALVPLGVVELVEALAPCLLLVDDLQWADSSSLETLELLASRSEEVLLVVAYRPEEVVAGGPAERFLAGLAELHSLEITLGPLGVDAIRCLVDSDDVASAVAEHTDGTPFAVLQTLRTLEREGLLHRSDSAGRVLAAEVEQVASRAMEVSRDGQRDAVWRQFERLPDDSRRLLGTLSLVARPVTVELLAATGSLGPEATLRLLLDLSRHHLVRHDGGGFRVDHDLVAETIQERLDPVERARVHHALAAALDRTGGPTGELARHLAGAGDGARAASAYAAAAAARLDRFADREAAQLAADGLALEPDGDTRAALLEVRAETLARQGDPAAARGDLRAAIALASGAPARSRMLTRLAGLTSGAEDMLRAAELADLALAEAGDDRSAVARATYVRALVDMNLGHQADAEARLDEALQLFKDAGDATGVADILDARAMTVFGNGDIFEGIDQFERVARLFADQGNLLRVVTPRTTRGHGLLFAGRPDEGLVETSAALDLARTLGTAEGEAMVLWHHSEVLVGCGRVQEGLAAADLGHAIARRIGHRGWSATTLRARGVALEAVGDLVAAQAAYEESLSTSGATLLIFSAWAHARLALLDVHHGRLDSAAAHIDRALATGPGLALHEARLAQCELAVRTGTDDAPQVLEEALRIAETSGHLVCAVRIRELVRDITAP